MTKLNAWPGVMFCSVSLTLMIGCGGAPDSAREAPADDPAKVARLDLPSGTARVSGTVTFEGNVPRLNPIDMKADPGCSVMHDEPVLPEVLVLGDGNTVANVLVRVKSGLPDVRWPAPAEPAVMDQKGCVYIPRIHGLIVGQTFRILNSDGLLHNVHAMPKVNRPFNMGMPATRTEADHVFDQPEDWFQIKCDVHPWMGAYVSVMTHPFFNVTEKDGRFEISGLPAGTYEIEAIHERLGAQTASVTVADGETQSVDFTYSR